MRSENFLIGALNPIVINCPVHGPAKAHRRCPAVGLRPIFQDALGTINGRPVDQTALAARATAEARASDEATVAAVASGTGRTAG